MDNFENRHAKNRTSPPNEAKYIEAYNKLNKSANKKGDGLDVAAVTTKSGEKGYGLMKEEFNRGHDGEYHVVQDFIPIEELKKHMKSN
jgi:hypothetical protein